MPKRSPDITAMTAHRGTSVRFDPPKCPTAEASVSPRIPQKNTTPANLTGQIVSQPARHKQALRRLHCASDSGRFPRFYYYFRYKAEEGELRKRQNWRPRLLRLQLG